MVNYYYQKGVRLERALVNEARRRGNIAFRSAGSHSDIDVCIIDFFRKQISLIQCKSGHLNKKEKEDLENKFKTLNKIKWKVYFDLEHRS